MLTRLLNLEVHCDERSVYIIANKFEDLSLNKIKIMEAIYNNDNIIKALLYRKETPSFLDRVVPSDYDRTSLLYSQIWPWKYIPQITDEANIYITSNFVFKPHDNMYKISNFYLYVICHKSLMGCDQGLVNDFILSELDNIFNQSRLVGIGRVQFEGMYEFSTDNSSTFLGSCIEYKTFEFN